MPVNPEKLEAAFSKADRVKGVAVPATLDLALERILVTRQRRLWLLSLDAALNAMPKAVGDELFSSPLIEDQVPAAMRAAVNQIYNRYSGLTRLKKEIRDQYDRAEKNQRKQFIKSINAAIGVSVADLLSDKRAAKAVDKRLKESVGLIKSLDKEMKARLLREMSEGIAKGRDALNIKKMVLQNTHLPEYRARLIARDQLGKLFSNLAQTRQEDIGVKEYIWTTVGDGAVRPRHAARDGKKFKWSDPPDGGHPGTEVQCRCLAEPVLKTAEILKVAA